MENNPNSTIYSYHIVEIFQEFCLLWQFRSDNLSHAFTLSYFSLRLKYFTFFIESRSSRPRYCHIDRLIIHGIHPGTCFPYVRRLWWVDRVIPWYFLVRVRDFLITSYIHNYHFCIVPPECCHWVYGLFLLFCRVQERSFVLLHSEVQTEWDPRESALFCDDCVLLSGDFLFVWERDFSCEWSGGRLGNNYLHSSILWGDFLYDKTYVPDRKSYLEVVGLLCYEFCRWRELFLSLWAFLLAGLVWKVWDSERDRYHRVTLLLLELCHSVPVLR